MSRTGISTLWGKFIVLIAVCGWCLSGQAKYSGGSGEPNDPYQIATPEDLNDIGNHTEDWDKHFILVNDVNLAQYTGTQFRIIGNYATKFTGVFDGNDHKVWNFTWSSTGGNCIGLFGYTGGSAHIKNLGMENVNVNASDADDVGAIVAENDGTIANCYCKGRVAGDYVAGGFVCSNRGTINSCYSEVTVSGNKYVGGLAGSNGRGAEIKNSHSSGNVYVVGYGAYCIGGLAGWNGGTISDSYFNGSVSGKEEVGGLVGDNSGTIVGCYSNADVAGTYEVGGLVGENGSSASLITLCKSMGIVNGGSRTGGLVGFNFDGGRVSSCYSTATVSGSDDVGGLVGENAYSFVAYSYSRGNISGGRTVGGFVGFNRDGAICIACYSTGSVTGETDAGGFVGREDDYGLSTACFWDVNTSERTTSAGGAGKTTAEMQDVNTFLEVGWDFGGETGNGTCNFWQMPESGGYPVLSISNGYIPGEPSGSGTEADPYIITDANELGTVWYRPLACYVMANDIDLAGMNWSAPVVPWFSGVFDGNDYVIRNADVNVPGSDYVGLFGYLGMDGQIRSLGVEDTSVIGGYAVGGLVGENEGTVSACYSTGSVSGSSSVGGLVGYNYEGTISNSYSTGSVSGTGYNVGGLVGANVSGDITNCYSTGSVSGSSSVGGLVGMTDYYYTGTISDCYSTGSVSGSSSVAGLVGYNVGVTMNCYSTGSVTGTDSVGGLVGRNGYYERYCHEVCDEWGCYEQCEDDYDPGWIYNCYSTGKVSGGSGIGGLVGVQVYGEVEDSCWDIETSELSTSARGTAKTTAEMKTQSTFTSEGWDFIGETANGTADIWRMCVDGVDYPRLRWEYVQGGDFACPDGINGGDLEVLCQDWLSTYPQALYGADANGDKEVTFADFDILADHWLSGL